MAHNPAKPVGPDGEQSAADVGPRAIGDPIAAPSLSRSTVRPQEDYPLQPNGPNGSLCLQVDD